MKLLTFLFCFLSFASIAQRKYFSLSAPLNLSQGKELVDVNPTLNFDSFSNSEFISLMQKHQMYNVPLEIYVDANGKVSSIFVSQNPDYKTMLTADVSVLNQSLSKFIGNTIVSTPATKGKKSVPFQTTIVLMLQENNLIINPILHD